jgi:hypothetical protein
VQPPRRRDRSRWITAEPAAYLLDWTIGDGDRQVGVGLVEGTRLAVGWGSAQSRPELAVYRRTELGLVGRRVERTPGRPTIRRERLVGRSDDRLGIAGTIGHFASAEAGAVVTGVGLTLDGEDAVAVGWGSDVGVAVYSLSGPELRGRWAAAGGTYVGSEVLVRT